MASLVEINLTFNSYDENPSSNNPEMVQSEEEQTDRCVMKSFAISCLQIVFFVFNAAR